MTKLEIEFALAQQVNCITEIRSTSGEIACDQELLNLVSETIQKELSRRLRALKNGN